MHPPTLLLISTDPSSRPLLEQAFPNPQTAVLSATTTARGAQLLVERSDITLVLLDDRDQHIARDEILNQARRLVPPVPVIILGKDDSARSAVQALQAGACNYLAPPLSVDALKAVLPEAQSNSPPPAALQGEPSPPGFQQIISASPQMRLVKHLAREVADSDATVLITGESGTGKELFARAIHAASPRADGPFLALNCAGIPEHLLESELFGYRRGAFTDAKQAKPGRFQLAESGTLFLDEIGEMSLPAQAKLLRVLEDHVIDPLGDTQSVKVNIRVIAATNEDLPMQIKSGRFRLDLFYRLNVYQLRIPPLRERTEDIEPILLSFLDSARHLHGSRIRRVSPDALALLRRHDWPGNVRELHNVVEGLTITCKVPEIRPEHLPTMFREWHQSGGDPDQGKASLLAFGLSFQEMEKKLLEEALRQTSGNVSEASRLLKLTRNTLRYRMAKYHIS
jgi:DNA-binding NtrC family response regulator